MSFVWPTSHVGMVHPLASSARARTQGTWFLRMAEAAERGLSYDETKALFPNVDAATVETRKSLYEEFGLLYVPKYSGTPHLTSVGKQLFTLLGTHPPSDPSEVVRSQVDSLLCWAMSHTQINRPQSLGSPNITEEERADCDIRPYAAFWQAMLELAEQSPLKSSATYWRTSSELTTLGLRYRRSCELESLARYPGLRKNLTISAFTGEHIYV